MSSCSEHAGEIRGAFPNKESYARKRVVKDVESRSVNVAFNDCVDDFELAPIKTRSGRQIGSFFFVRFFYGYGAKVYFLNSDHQYIGAHVR